MAELSSEIKLSEMIEALRVELAVAVEGGKGKAIGFDVGPVELEVEVAVTKKTTGSGGVEFWVIKAGAERAREDVVTHRVKVTLEPKDARTRARLTVSLPSDELPRFEGIG